MTHRERFLASLRPGGAVDRFFRYEHGPWPTTRQRWLGEGWPADLPFGTFFAMDPLLRIGVNSGYTHCAFHPFFPSRVLEEAEDYRITVDGDGITKKNFMVDSDTSMPQFLRFPVTNRADWNEVRQRLNPADAAARIGDVASLTAACADSAVPTLLPICGAFGQVRNLLGEEALAYLLYDDPGLLESMLENWRDLYVALLRQLTARVRVDALLFWEDMCFRGGPLISPAHFRQYMLSPYRDVVAAARAGGVQRIIVDTDGDCLPMIPVFLDADVDALMPFEVQAGMDVVAIRRRYPTLGIMGGLDKRPLAADNAAIRREVQRVLPHFRGQAGFLPTLDHTVPPNVSLKSFQYFLACVREFD